MLLGTQKYKYLKISIDSFEQWKKRVGSFFEQRGYETYLKDITPYLKTIELDGKKLVDDNRRYNEAITKKALDDLAKSRTDCTKVNELFVASLRSMHWKVFQATMIRNGEYNDNDINMKMAKPITQKLTTNYPLINLGLTRTVNNIIKCLEKQIAEINYVVGDRSFKMTPITNEALRIFSSYSDILRLPTQMIISKMLKKHLSPYYTDSIRQEKGTGTYDRMHSKFKQGIQPSHEELFSVFQEQLAQYIEMTNKEVESFYKFSLSVSTNHFSNVSITDKLAFALRSSIHALVNKIKDIPKSPLPNITKPMPKSPPPNITKPMPKSPTTVTASTSGNKDALSTIELYVISKLGDNTTSNGALPN